MTRHRKQKYIAIALISATVLAAILLDYREKIKNHLTLFQQIGETAYQSLIKPEDRAPLPVSLESVKNGKTVKLPILMYHHVGAPPPNADKVRLGLTVSAQDFSDQVKWLKEQGFASVSLQDFYNYGLGNNSLWPKKPVIFTFDDGYADVFDNAIPILHEYGFTGVFGIITQYPAQIQGSNFYASWQQIALAKQQGMEIVCHTQNHFDGSDKKYTENYIYENLSGCQQDIRDHLGDAGPFLIYPYGHYTAAYITQAKKAGFVMALTVHEGRFINLNDLMRMPRIRMEGGETLEKFIKMVGG